MASDALLLGRVTYEGFAKAWPSRDGEFADKFNSMPKYVVSSTLLAPEWTNTTVLEGDLADEVAELKEKHAGDIVVHGSGSSPRPARERPRRRAPADGVPFVLGTGKRLFGERATRSRWLRDSKVVGDGVAILSTGAPRVRAGPPKAPSVPGP